MCSADPEQAYTPVVGGASQTKTPATDGGATVIC
jgi:hypothetical protein